MASRYKFEELAGLALENGLRLHVDSTQSYHGNSFATAYQLALTASEEIGKALLLEEYFFQSIVNGWNEVTMRSYLVDIFSNHRIKQKAFATHANTFLRRHKLRNASALITPLMKGIGEHDKQNSTYVGLTRLFAQPPKARGQITLNSDFLIVYIDGFLRGLYATDSYSMACLMDKHTLEILEDSWITRGKLASQILNEHNKHNRVANPLSDWE